MIYIRSMQTKFGTCYVFEDLGTRESIFLFGDEITLRGWN